VSRKLIIILSATASVLLLGLATGYFIWFRNQPPPVNANQPADNSQNNVTVNNGNVAPVNNDVPLGYQGSGAAPGSETDDDSQIRLVAKSFVEKYGTFSTDVNYANLEGLKYLLTDSMKADINKSVAAGQSNQTGSVSFYGVTTKALVTKIINQDSGQGEVFLTTQRSEVFSRTATPILRYQDIKVGLSKVNGQWLVNEVEWIKGE